MTIFAIGDSHSIFFHNSNIIKEHWLGFDKSFPVTWFRLIKEGLDLYSIGSKLGNGHGKYNIKSGDYVMFCYGWNDIQKNIYKYAKDNYKEELEKLINNYITLLIKYKEKYKIIPIVQNIYPNPIKTEAVEGPPEIRTEYIKYANKILKEKCFDNSLYFFDNYNLITDENGYIKKEYTKDLIHLDYDNKFLSKELDNILIRMTKYISYPYKSASNKEEKSEFIFIGIPKSACTFMKNEFMVKNNK